MKLRELILKLGRGVKMKKGLMVLALTFALTLGFSAVAFATNPIDTTTSPATYKAPTGDSTTSQPAYPVGQTNPYIAIGTDGVAKNIHSGYQRNTDACASCHATHTAIGVGLLQWATVSATCDACHDGTVSTTYDVNNGMIASTTARTMGGLFAYTEADTIGNATSTSKHNVSRLDFTNPILGAPGGSITGTADGHGTWSGGFECISCHEPHGKLGNYRILNPNANEIAVQNKVTTEQATSTDNLTFKASKGNWVLGYPLGVKVYVGGTASTDQVKTGFTQDIFAGTITFTAVQTGPVYITYYPGLKINGSVTSKLTVNENPTYDAGMNGFCGTCHTDYNTEATVSPHANLNGTYSKAYRHAVGYTYSPKEGLAFATGNTVTCLTCHVAHGTDQKWWTDWATKTGWKGVVTSEDAGSSVLKRLPNMSTCETCHAKGVASGSY